MRRKGISTLGIGLAATICLLTALLFGTLGRARLPEGVLAAGAVGLQVEAVNWQTTNGKYETPLRYQAISNQVRQQMADQGWRLLGTSLTAGPSILNADPPSILFERAYLFGTLYEIARISCVNGPTTRVRVVVLRTIRWPAWRQWLRLS